MTYPLYVLYYTSKFFLECTIGILVFVQCLHLKFSYVVSLLISFLLIIMTDHIISIFETKQQEKGIVF